MTQEANKTEQLKEVLREFSQKELKPLLPMINFGKELRNRIRPEREIVLSASLFLLMYLVNSDPSDFEKRSESLSWLLELFRKGGGVPIVNAMYGPLAVITLFDGTYRMYDEYVKALYWYIKVREPGYVSLLTEDDNEAPNPQ
jgi:hypothetical protein